MGRPLAYWHSGGAILATGSVTISPASVRPILRAIDGERAAMKAEGDREGAQRLLCAGLSLINAAQQQARWKRCMDGRAA